MSRLWSTLALRFVLLVGSLGAASCGDDHAPVEPEPEPEPEAWTLDNVCPRFAERFCQTMKGCCDESGFAYDEAGCSERFERSACQPYVELARAGRVSFNLELFSQAGADAAVDACLETFATHFERCQTETLYDFFDLVAELNSGACELFSGGAGVGAECSQTAECAKPFTAGSWVYCNAGTCNHYALLSENNGCFWQGIPCIDGLSCNAPYGQSGTCVPTIQPGGSCEPDPLNPMCGLAGFCDLATGTCRAASKGYGETCGVGCQSGLCLGGRCTHPMRWIEGPGFVEVSLSPEMCRGSGGP